MAGSEINLCKRLYIHRDFDIEKIKMVKFKTMLLSDVIFINLQIQNYKLTFIKDTNY